jgi:hypothetical protein
MHILHKKYRLQTPFFAFFVIFSAVLFPSFLSLNISLSIQNAYVSEIRDIRFHVDIKSPSSGPRELEFKDVKILKHMIAMMMHAINTGVTVKFRIYASAVTVCLLSPLH